MKMLTGLLIIKMCTGLLVISAVLASSCTHSETDFTRLMRQEGVTKAKDEGYAVFGCAESDQIHTAFSGVKNGSPVRGVICGGLFKLNTIRYE